MDTLQHGAGNQSAEAMARVHVGGYEIKGVIGEGGTGVVYRGRHVASDRTVAIKILHDRGARQKEVVEQFIGEARATSRIRHPNVIEVTDLGTTPEGTVFLVMEYLEGESLRNRLHSVQHLPLFEAINILRQVARGLGAAHEAGIVHGGLKPADIFLCSRKGRRRIVRRSKAQGMRLVVEPEENFDLVKLLDFGMARFLDLAPGAQAPAGAVSGTLHYLSPEQAQGEPTDQRSDIYSLGAVFYEMITGTVPFDGESLLDILRGHVSGQVIAPSRRTPGAGIHMRIDELILKCLKKNPNLRFVDTSELCEALDACITDRAFLRDAHRLPGIVESGIDLSEASPEAREDPARSAEKPAATPGAAKAAVRSVAEEPVVASGAQKTAVAPAAEKPAGATVLQKPPAAAPVAAKPAVAPMAEKPGSVLHKLADTPVAAKPSVTPMAEKPASVLDKPVAAPAAAPAASPVAAQSEAASVAQKPAVAPVAEKPASFLRKPAAAPVTEKPAAVPVVAKSTASLFASKPVTAPAVLAHTKAPMADDPAAAVITPPPTMVAQADDPAAAVNTPPPAMVATADDPAAAVNTPPPTAVVMADDPAASVNTPPPAARAAELPVGISAGTDDQPSRMNLARPEAIVPDADERPERFDREASWRRPRVIALAGMLLLSGVGIAVWAARNGSAPSSKKPAAVSQTAPAPTPAPPPLAAAPVPAVPAGPAVPVPPPSPPPVAAAPVVAPAAPAAAPAATLPRLEPAVPAAMARATARGPGKRASARIRHAQASRASRKAPVIPAPSETETAPATELETAPAAETEASPAAKPRPQRESEPPVPSIAPAEPKPSPPAPASADDLVREAQHAWMAGHYALAISKAQAALKAEPKHAQAVQAYEIIATSSCAIGQTGAAREAASHLSDAERDLVRTMCKASGVTIE